MIEVVVFGSSTSIEEWERASCAPKEELPLLTDEQKEWARKFGLSEESYARSLLAGQYGAERIKARAEEFGKILEKILTRIAPKMKDGLLVFDFGRDICIVRLKKGKREVRVRIPRKLADDVLDLRDLQSIRELEEILKDALQELKSTSSPRAGR